ncbi:fibronectin type III domain-containing protein [Teredinibacter sp. KSP-S5-2]|uniref:fibronectin type III domain-containing protein n=1 Tax=Teredinibacter sp. KSP-S5-2 TaxID=3034506 RepID=UPI00293507FE|nr:fibronectin type III domain-containing protein [Teredinibacter sp. KSP-S5-2]WNO09371.1 fibronectin type III domain-containing protein [Teredinibacter sp. KSP-S5-2]
MNTPLKLILALGIASTLVACGGSGEGSGLIAEKPPVENPGTQPTEPSDPIADPTDPVDPVSPTEPSPQKVSASVEWMIPTTRENGADLPLGEIGGYVIIYRRTDQLTYTEVEINDQTITEYVIENLDAGEYEFLITAYDTDNLFSSYSDPIIAQLTI